MPLHDFLCPVGHLTEAVVDHGVDSIPCPQCSGCSPECAAKHIPGYEVLHVGLRADKVFLKAPMTFVRQDVNYTSPVDGRPITSWQAHLDELARTDTIVYEPGIKQDQERNARLREEALEQSIEKTVEKEIALMPAHKKEKLVAELEGGITAEPARITPPQVSYRDAK